MIFSAFSPVKSEAREDTIIAIVNEDVITSKELHDYLRTTYLQLSSQGLKEGEIAEIMKDFESNGIDHLIENKLLVSEANRQKLSIRDKLVDNKLAEIRSRYPSEQAFVDSLVADGLTISDVRNKIRDQMKAKFLVDHAVKSKVFVNPQEVTDYYNNHPEAFKKQERLDLESIFIPFEPDKKSAQKTINDILERLKKGEDFASLAKEFSKAPAIGMVEKGQLLPSIESVVFALKENELSNPMETEKGIYLFLIKKRLPSEQASFDEVKDFVYNYLFQEKYKKKTSAWLEDLKKKAYIEIKS